MASIGDPESDDEGEGAELGAPVKELPAPIFRPTVTGIENMMLLPPSASKPRGDWTARDFVYYVRLDPPGDDALVLEQFQRRAQPAEFFRRNVQNYIQGLRLEPMDFGVRADDDGLREVCQSKYTFLQRLGAGVHGAVYAVFDQARNERVALKTVNHFSELFARPAGWTQAGIMRHMAQRLDAERRIFRMLQSHQDAFGGNWAQYYEGGTCTIPVAGRLAPYYTMKLYDADLAEYLDSLGNRLDRWELLMAFAELVHALAVFREVGVVHGDIRRQNILVETSRLGENDRVYSTEIAGRSGTVQFRSGFRALFSDFGLGSERPFRAPPTYPDRDAASFALDKQVKLEQAEFRQKQGDDFQALVKLVYDIGRKDPLIAYGGAERSLLMDMMRVDTGRSGYLFKQFDVMVARLAEGHVQGALRGRMQFSWLEPAPV